MWKIDRGSAIDTSTAEYSNALDWITTEMGEKTILLKNCGSSASLRYKMTGYAAENGIAVEIVAENTLLAGEIARLHYKRQWHRLVLQVANGSGEADYQVDYEGQGA
jgi:hypothetical protein